MFPATSVSVMLFFILCVRFSNSERAYFAWRRPSHPLLLHLFRNCAKSGRTAAPEDEARRANRSPCRHLALLAIVARGEAGLPAEEPREMTWVCVANVERNLDDSFLRFAEQPSRSVHPKIRVEAGG